jgi:hypothetical protein
VLTVLLFSVKIQFRYLFRAFHESIIRQYILQIYIFELLDFWTFPSYGIVENRKHDVPKTGSVSVLRLGKKTPIQLCPLERANLDHWITQQTTRRYAQHNIFT